MFPSIAEYTSALRHAESGTFRSLRLALSVDEEGEPIYSRGSYSVVFKAHSIGNEREAWAIKCYVAEQERRMMLKVFKINKQYNRFTKAV